MFEVVDAGVFDIDDLYDPALLDDPPAALTLFKEIGGDIMSRSPLDGSQEVFETRWISHFEAVPEVCVQTWAYLQIDLSVEEDWNSNPRHLLWAYLLLKTYASESVLSAICKCHKDTFRKYAWQFINKLSFLEFELVRTYVRSIGRSCRRPHRSSHTLLLDSLEEQEAQQWESGGYL